MAAQRESGGGGGGGDGGDDNVGRTFSSEMKEVIGLPRPRKPAAVGAADSARRDPPDAGPAQLASGAVVEAEIETEGAVSLHSLESFLSSSGTARRPPLPPLP